MAAVNLNVRYPDVGEYIDGCLPQACYDELRAAVEDPPVATMLAGLAQLAGRDGVAFATYCFDGMTVMDDEHSELVFAIGKDILFPDEDEEPMGARVQRFIVRYYVDEVGIEVVEEEVVRELVDAVANEQSPESR